MALSAALHGAARGDAAAVQTRSPLSLALQPILDDNTTIIESTSIMGAHHKNTSNTGAHH